MKAIEIIFIPVTKPEAAKQFYLTFGFKLLVDSPFENGRWISLALPGQESLSLTLVPGIQARNDPWFCDENG